MSSSSVVSLSPSSHLYSAERELGVHLCICMSVCARACVCVQDGLRIKKGEREKRERETEEGEGRTGGVARPLILAHLTTETRSSGQSPLTHTHTLYASRTALFKHTHV